MDDMQQFKQTYITECFELLEDMEARLLSLDEGTTDLEMLNAIFRCAHSIKGGAGAFGFKRITSFTHVLETLLDKVREGEMVPTRQMIDILLASTDVLKNLVEAARDGKALEVTYGAATEADLQALMGAEASAPAHEEKKPAVAQKKSGREIILYGIKCVPHKNILLTGNEPLLLLRELRSLGKATVIFNGSRLPSLEDMNPEECYLSWEIDLESEHEIERIKEVFEFVEDECAVEIEVLGGFALPDAVQEEKEPVAAAAAPKPAAPSGSPVASPAKKADASKEGEDKAKAMAVSSIRVDLEKIDRLVNMVGELVITQAMLQAQSKLIPAEQYPDLVRGIEELSQHSRELQESVMSVRMQPVKSVFSRMPRIVRDLCRALNKDIRLEMVGENTEVDKTVVEQLTDPITHMIRNSVDHGISIPEQRIKQGKLPQGVIRLSAEHRGGRIVIEVADDGQGINRERVLSKAKEKGLVSQEAILSDEEIDNLIFHPGFSTAETVSDVSGRGVGMDVVKRNIENLGGTVTVRSTPGKGSNITISLPLTLAILDGMIVRVGREFYIIPISNIIETLKPRKEEVRKIADSNDLINVRGEFVPMLYLYQLFGVKNAGTEAYNGLVVLIENGVSHFGLVVDELVGQQQVVIKSLEENSDPIKGISGATILGDGKVSLILDVAGLSQVIQTNKTRTLEIA